jgi:hypothetical protein
MAGSGSFGNEREDLVLEIREFDRVVRFLLTPHRASWGRSSTCVCGQSGVDRGALDRAVGVALELMLCGARVVVPSGGPERACEPPVIRAARQLDLLVDRDGGQSMRRCVAEASVTFWQTLLSG